jgi:sugar lactone lactonase YvrE
MLTPVTALDVRCTLGEGPVWDADRKAIWWVDIIPGRIHCLYTETGKHRTLEIGVMVGAVALRENGGLIGALRSGFCFIDPETGECTPIANPEANVEGNRFNDGKVDPQGRFWAGTMSMNDEPKKGALYMLERDGTVQRRLDNISISNGLAWDSESSVKFYIDTPTMEVRAFDYDRITGEISDGRTVITIPPELGDPDGMTIDAEGMLWIAHWDGWQITRWNPKTGEQLRKIELPVGRVTSCTFGGADLDDLYITSARVGLSKDDLEQQPLAGSLFVIKNCGYRGLAPHRYAG